jgi:hypothetical protein
MRFLILLPATFAVAVTLVLVLVLGAGARSPQPASPSTPPAVVPTQSPATAHTPSPQPSAPTQTVAPSPTPLPQTPVIPTPVPVSPTPEPSVPATPYVPVHPGFPDYSDGETEEPGQVPSEVPAEEPVDEPPASPWNWPVMTPDGAAIGVVSSDTLNVRQAPSLNAPVVRVTLRRHLVHVYEQVAGDSVDGDTRWYRIGDSQFVSAALITPFVPDAPAARYAGHWLDVNLSTYYAVAYDGDTPVYAAIVRTGRSGDETPAGEFTIFHRVANETMDAATLGISKDDPGYYYVPDVKYTQYFAAGGYALHTNHWTSPAEFGQQGSHGCVNLFEADAKFLWEFLSHGSQVSIHP